MGRYVRSFDAEVHRAQLDVDAQVLSRMQRTTVMDAQNHDPLKDWYDLVTFVALAALNHQPITSETWEENQLSGYFGVPLAE